MKNLFFALTLSTLVASPALAETYTCPSPIGNDSFTYMMLNKNIKENSYTMTCHYKSGKKEETPITATSCTANTFKLEKTFGEKWPKSVYSCPGELNTCTVTCEGVAGA